ncbi:MAG: hypothetical protein GT600_10485 [Bacteroidales bacterium]|jgi:hypothetical protein|nr:hypothetical protein [Bacteroidales bacterium]NMD04201.1 hypothetical protein [Bacteroidales bacterium]OQB60033.1 MAG: hypothetical protein BWX96_02384 [Bacteroidetes bacterium ADurb.Bin145]HOU02293.1 hypothetical protein [Bacteroidales bacterium]HQK68298.1 hypothetical protein [Bacteroidales bacterium]
MKQVIILFSVMIMMMITLLPCKLSAQTNSAIEDFFVGKWDIVVQGLTNYDINLSVDIKKIEGEIKGEISMPSFGVTGVELQGITIADSTLAVNTGAIGFDMPLILTKKDEKTLTGSLMGFPFESVRSDQK